jgi:DNA-binding CsgD family transcriptional regulator
MLTGPRSPFSGTFSGTISGTISGTVSSTISGTVSGPAERSRDGAGRPDPADRGRTVLPGTTAVLGRVAASPAPAPARGRALLVALRAAVPFDAAWLAHADPSSGRYSSLASLDLRDDVAEFLCGPTAARDVTAIGADRGHDPISPTDASCRAGRLPTWADCLSPAGFPEALAMALFATGGRRVGLLLLLFRTPSSPAPQARRRLTRLAPVLASSLDPMTSLLATTRLVPDATAGTALREDGATEALPGLAVDPLVEAGSPVLSVARARLGAGFHSRFLWPRGGPYAPDGHVQVTAVATPADVPFLLGVVLVGPVRDLRGLTPRELEVLGLITDGHTNQEIARTLFIAPRTVAAHVEHVLVKLGASTRTTAAVLAEREGLYVPASAVTSPRAAGWSVS